MTFTPPTHEPRLTVLTRALRILGLYSSADLEAFERADTTPAPPPDGATDAAPESDAAPSVNLDERDVWL